MRRTDREISNINEIIKCLGEGNVCNLAINDEKYPYIIPLNYGYEATPDKINIYFHCAKTGKKIDLIKLNPNVSFSIISKTNLILKPNACDSTMEFESICGRGNIIILKDDDKIHGLNILMDNFRKNTVEHYEAHLLERILVLKLEVVEITGKRLNV